MMASVDGLVVTTEFMGEDFDGDVLCVLGELDFW